MRKICLVSDTHGHIDDRMLEMASTSDEIWHAGDFGGGNVSEKLAAAKPLRGVFGNIDSISIRMVYPEFLVFAIEEVRVLMIHIAGPFGSYTPAVRNLLEQHRPTLLVCGHSHILKIQRDEKRKMLYMNPGAAGKHGFHKVRTMLRFTIDGKSLTGLEAIELGLRGAID